MSEKTSIHDVAAMVGIDRKTSEEIVAEAKENQRKLSGCNLHEFSICLDRLTRQPIQNPTAAQKFGARWRCIHCAGEVDASAKSWYEKGIRHTQLQVQSVVEKFREKKESKPI